MMHVGINTLSVIPGETGGGETYLVNLIRALAAVDPANRYTLIAGRENRDCFAPPAGNFETVLAPVSLRHRVRRVLYEHLHLPRLARRLGVDVLYCPGNAAPARSDCATVLGVQSLLHILSPEEVGPARRAYFRSVLPRSARRVRRVIAVSEDIKRRLLEHVDIPAEKVRVVYEGVDAAFGRASRGEVDRGLGREHLAPGYILFVSTLKPYKNADKLIRAAAHLKQARGVEKQVAIAGRDPVGLVRELRALAEGLGIGEQVHFLGPVAHERLPAFYSGAAVFVYPSRIETFGLPVLEAMACGAPVIGSDRAAVPEIIGDAGICVDPDDVAALADAMYRVLADDALQASLRAKGYDRVRSFTWERAARETLAVFEEAWAEQQSDEPGELR